MMSSSRPASENLVCRITYIPGILIFALIAIAVATGIPLGMLLHSGDTIMLRKWRVLDPPRLVFDCAEAFQKADSLVAVEDLGLGKLRTLAGKMMMGYHVVDEGSGSQVALRLESRWGGGKVQTDGLEA